MKRSVPVKQFWYSDIVVFPKIVTIITTVDEAGKVNAAPYAYFMHHDVLDIISKKGADKVTYEHYMKLVEEFAPKDPQNRFNKEVDD